MCVHAKLLQSCPTPYDPVNCRAPLCMGFSRQEYWSGLPRPPPGDLPKPGIKPALCLLHWQAGSLLLVPPGKPQEEYSEFTFGDARFQGLKGYLESHVRHKGLKFWRNIKAMERLQNQICT